MKKIITILICCLPIFGMAQGLSDGQYMPKKQICTGLIYSHDSWNEYWEGTLKRENLNIGTVTTQSIAWMGSYGLTDRITIAAGLPYIWTKATAGTLAGMKGVQDFSLGLKYKASETELLNGKLTTSLALGFSIPTNNYVADFLPLAIGLQSKTAFARGIIHYQHSSNLMLTIQGAYVYRSNVDIDRTAYYTTQQNNANEVNMPNVANFGARLGYYAYRWSAEAVYDQMITLGGYDIRRNDMPFPSNKMNANRLGVALSYRIKPLADVQLVANGFYTLAGRNVGQSLTWSAGVMRIFKF